MKTPIQFFSFVVITAGLVAGCGENMSPSRGQDVGNQLSASDLALITDVHVWKARVPEKQRPIKEIRLVILNYRRAC